MESNQNLTDFVHFEAMLSAIGVIKPKTDKILSNIIENTIKPWKPKSPEEECPF